MLLVIAPAMARVSSQSAADLRGVARAGGRPSTDTVVWLDAPSVPAPASPPRARLDQWNLRFSPTVLVVRAGTLVDFPNSDRVFHNVFSFRDGKRFDLGLYPVGTMRRVAFDRPGLSRVFCNIHPNMAAYVMTVDSPYFARSDEAGAFTIAGVPDGSHTYHAWRPGAVDELTGTWAPADGALSPSHGREIAARSSVRRVSADQRDGARTVDHDRSGRHGRLLDRPRDRGGRAASRLWRGDRRRSVLRRSRLGSNVGHRQR